MRVLSLVCLGLGFLLLVSAFHADFLLRAFLAFSVFLLSAWCWDRANKREGIG